MKSIPVAAKVGGAGVLGGGGIAGTGVLIHNRLQKAEEVDYKLKDLDNKLIADEKATLSFPANTTAFISTTAKKTEATIIVTTTSEDNNNPFKTANKWTCTIRGIVIGGEQAVDLTKEEYLKKTDQANSFKTKLEVKDAQKQTQTFKEGFVKSCARNRPETVAKAEETLSSTLVVHLALKKTNGNTKEYEFPSKSIEDIFNGDWVNQSEK